MRFIAADMPQANDLTVGIITLVAKQERESIARRTREARAAAKARGTKLGNPNGAAALRRVGRGNTAILETISTNADAYTAALEPIVADVRRTGRNSLRAIAEELNERRIVTRRGGRWHVSNVRNLLMRVAQERAEEGE